MTDIESVYGAWCVGSMEVRRSRCPHKLGTQDFTTIGEAHYHRPSINPRMRFNTLTGGAGRDGIGSGELAADH